MNLRDTITQGEWKAENILGFPRGGRPPKITCEGDTLLQFRGGDVDEIENLAKAIAQVPNLLGLVDILSQRLEEKYKDTPEDEIPMDELNELLACRKIQKAILN